MLLLMMATLTEFSYGRSPLWLHYKIGKEIQVCTACSMQCSHMLRCPKWSLNVFTSLYLQALWVGPISLTKRWTILRCFLEN